MRLLSPANSSHLRSLRSATVHGANLHSSCKLVQGLQSAHAAHHLGMHLRFEFLSKRIRLCPPTGMPTCSTTELKLLLRGHCRAHVSCRAHDNEVLKIPGHSAVRAVLYSGNVPEGTQSVGHSIGLCCRIQICRGHGSLSHAHAVSAYHTRPVKTRSLPCALNPHPLHSVCTIMSP